jgi:ATP-dependent DNA helicase DinG
VAADECLGKACERYADCFAERMKQRAEAAKVVVANYHLLFADMQVKGATEGEVGVLPSYDILILDEADKMPDISRDFYGFRIVEGSIRWASRLLTPTGSDAQKLPQIDAALKERIASAASRFFADLLVHRRSKEYRARLRRPDIVPWKELHSLLLDAARLYDAHAKDSELEQADRKRLRNASTKCAQIAAGIRRACSSGFDTTVEHDDVFFLEELQNDRVALRGAPVDVAKQLRRDIWGAELRSAIAVSATLTTGGTFDFFVRESGADGADELAVDSPFDIRRNMLVVIPAEAVDPKNREFAEAAGDFVVRAVELARGRTLGLFTSHRGLKEAAHRVRRAHGRTYEILVQGDAPRMQLVGRFREEVSTVLLGTDSFWTGVDVPGEALSCLVIDKIPFPSPDDPILDALDEREDNAWANHSLPRALIQFRQGIGRLLRTATDRGVVVICDPRIVEKGYGRGFVKACGGARVTRDIQEIATFLAGHNVPETKVRGGARVSRRRESTI